MVRPRLINTDDTPRVDASAYGVVAGDASVDNAAALAEARDAAAEARAGVQLPSGRIYVSTSLELRLDSTYDHAGVGFFGASHAVDRDNPLRTSLVWNGAATDQPMIKAWARGNRFQNIHFDVASGKTCLAAVDMTKGDGAGAAASTDNSMVDCRIHGDLGGTFTYGVKLADKIGAGAYPTNCDFFKFHRCFIWADSKAVYCPNTTGQAKRHTFTECVFYGAEYGLHYESGSFSTWACNFSSCDVGIYAVRPTDTLGIYETDSEYCGRFLVTGTGSASWAVKICGGRLDCTGSLHADNVYISNGNCGALILDGVYIAGPDTLKIASGNNSVHTGGTLTAIGCTFPSETPFALLQDVFCQRRIVLGCRWYDEDANARPIDDQIIGLGLNNGYTLQAPERLLVSNFGVTNPYDSDATAMFRVGSGSPEGAVTGNVGDEYTDATGGVKYLKATGAGTNTGWVAFLTA